MTGKTELKERFGVTARLILGGVFLYAGFLKTAAPAEEFAYAIETYRVMPQALALPAALFVSWLEVYLGVFLVAGLFARQCALLAGALLAGFEALLLQAMLRKLPITSCGCFGASASSTPGYEFAQNIFLLLLAFLAYKYGARLSADALMEK